MSVKLDGPVPAPRGLVQAHVDHIEDELTQRWREDAERHGAPHMHSCAMTLIVWLGEDDHSRVALDVIEQLAGKHPIRAIVLSESERVSEDSIAAWIGNGCTGDDSLEAVCSEEIVLLGNVHAHDRVVSVVRGLLVPDLPVYLWWRSGSPVGSAAFRALRPLVDRIIVDSILFGDGAAGLDTLRHLVQQGAPRTSVRDLNWQRTEPWRNAIAACFDDGDVRAMLSHFNRAAVAYASPGEVKAPARSLLMSGWLASRWNALHGHTKVVADKHATIDAGRIVSILLSSTRSKAMLKLQRQDAPTGIGGAAHAPDGRALKQWLFAARTLPEAQLLDGCLDSLGRDPLFEFALEGG